MNPVELVLRAERDALRDASVITERTAHDVARHLGGLLVHVATLAYSPAWEKGMIDLHRGNCPQCLEIDKLAPTIQSALQSIGIDAPAPL